MSKPTRDHAEVERFALSLPEAWSDTPWEDDHVVKVGKKIFLFLGSGGSATIAVKLPESAAHALSVPSATPTSYALGRHGWCTIPVGTGDAPLDLVLDWVEESYRAVATKKLIKQLDDT